MKVTFIKIINQKEISKFKGRKEITCPIFTTSFSVYGIDIHMEISSR